MNQCSKSPTDVDAEKNTLDENVLCAILSFSSTDKEIHLGWTP